MEHCKLVLIAGIFLSYEYYNYKKCKMLKEENKKLNDILQELKIHKDFIINKKLSNHLEKYKKDDEEYKKRIEIAFLYSQDILYWYEEREKVLTEEIEGIEGIE